LLKCSTMVRPSAATRLDDHMAQWRGPLATPRGLRVGVRLPTGVVPATRAARPKAEEVNTNEPAPTMRDWVTRNSRQSWMRRWRWFRCWPFYGCLAAVLLAIQGFGRQRPRRLHHRSFRLVFWAYRLLGLATDPWLSAATRFGWGGNRRDICSFEPNAFFPGCYSRASDA